MPIWVGNSIHTCAIIPIHGTLKTILNDYINRLLNYIRLGKYQF